jgi:hypothetical protein
MRSRAAAALIVAAAAIAAALAPLDRAALTLAGWQAQGPFSRFTTFGAEAFSAHGLTSGAAGWLGTWIAGTLYALNPVLPAILNGLCAAAALAFLYARCARSNAAGALAVTGLCALCTAGGWGTATLGPELLALLGFCALLEIDGPAAYAAIAVCVVWANLSPSAFLAPLLALAATAGAVVDERGATPRLRRFTLITAGAIGAMALTPGGIDYASNAVTQLGLFDTSVEAFTAWDPSSRPIALLGGFAPLLVLSAWIGLRHGGGLRAALFSAAAIVLALSSALLLPLGAFAIAPVLTRAFARDGEPFAGIDARRLGLGAAALAGVCAAVLLVNAARSQRPSDGAAAAVAQARAAGARRFYCSAPSWCDYAAVESGLSVALDSRLRSYPAPARNDAVKVLHVEKGWPAVLDRWHVDAVVSGNDRALTALLMLDPRWRRLPSADPAVFVRVS